MEPPFAQSLYAARKSQGLTQQELGDRIGMKREYVIALEKGSPANPTHRTRKRLAVGLGMSLEEMEQLGREYAASFPSVVEDDATIGKDPVQIALRRRIKRMVDVVEWDQERESRIYDQLLEFAREDARRRSQ